MGEEIEHNCGVAAVVLLEDLANQRGRVLPALYQLMRLNQPRGRDGAGILTINDGKIHERIVSEGPVDSLFRAYTDADQAKFFGDHTAEGALGHNRYATTGQSLLQLLHPVLHNDPHLTSKFGFCFNGNLANWIAVKQLLEEICNYNFDLGNDTEVLEILLRHELRSFNPQNKVTLEQKLANKGLQSDTDLAKAFLENLRERESTGQDWGSVFYHLAKVIDGAWTLGLVRGTNSGHGEYIFARDPHGFRPAFWIIDTRRRMFAFSSESAGLGSISPQSKVQTLPPGYYLRVHNGQVEGPVSFMRSTITEVSPCLLDAHYFSAANSLVNVGISNSVTMTNYDARYMAGRLMADNDPLIRVVNRYNTFVVAIPNAALPFVEGLAEGLNLSSRQGIIKIGGRTFTKDSGDRGVASAYSYNPSISGRRIILADDSIVRLNTLPEVIAQVYMHGPSEIHVRIGTPPIIGICPYGINLRTLDELGATPFVDQFRRSYPDGSIDDMVSYIDQAMLAEIEKRTKGILETRYGLSPNEIKGPIVASLRYLNHSNLTSSFEKVETMDGIVRTGFDGKLCRGCITGKYPTSAGQKAYDAQTAARPT